MNLIISFAKGYLFIVGVIMLILVLIIPSIYANSLVENGTISLAEDSTVFPKTLFFIQCLISIGVLFSLALLLSKSFYNEFKISKIDLTLFIFVVYVILNRYLIQSDYNFSIRFIEFIGLSFFYVVIRILPSSYYPWFFLSIVFSCFLACCHGIIQLLGFVPSFNSRFVVTGSFVNPGPYAGFLAASWSVALGMYLFRDKLIDRLSSYVKEKLSTYVYKSIYVLFKYVPIITLISIILVLPVIKSRAAFLAIFLSSCLLVLYKYGLFNKINHISLVKKVAILLMSGLVFGIVLFGAYKLKKSSADGRILIWKVTSTIIADHPIIGVGFDRFQSHYMNAQANYFNKFKDPSEILIADTNWVAFNEVLQLITENGLIGFFIITLVGFWCMRLKVVEEDAFFKLFIIAVLLALTMFGLFSYPTRILPIKIIMVFSLAILSSMDNNKIVFSKPLNYLLSKTSHVIALSSLLLAWMSFQFIYKVKKGFSEYNHAIISFYASAPSTKNIGFFETSTPVLKKDGLSLLLYGQLLTKANQHEKAAEVLEHLRKHKNSTRVEISLGNNYKALKKYELSEMAYQKAADMIPGRFYPNYLLARLFEESGQVKKAEKKAKELLAKKIKVPSNAIDEIKTEMRRILGQKNTSSLKE